MIFQLFLHHLFEIFLHLTFHLLFSLELVLQFFEQDFFHIFHQFLSLGIIGACFGELSFHLFSKCLQIFLDFLVAHDLLSEFLSQSFLFILFSLLTILMSACGTFFDFYQKETVPIVSIVEGCNSVESCP